MTYPYPAPVEHLYTMHMVAVLAEITISDGSGRQELHLSGDAELMFNPEYAEVLAHGMLSKIGRNFSAIELIPIKSATNWATYRIEIT